MTETTGTISMCRHDDPPEVVAHTVGRPLPGVEVRVVDDDGLDVPAGELLARGFNVMQGYFDDEAATGAAIVDGWLRTGDIGFVEADGNIHVTDRKKDMFMVGGFNAYPAEIEAVLLGHPAVAQVAVVACPTSGWASSAWPSWSPGRARATTPTRTRSSAGPGRVWPSTSSAASS